MSRPFRISAKRFFLTFPQCDTDKAICADRITAKWGDKVVAFAIAAEHHAATEQDPIGGPHLHMIIHFDKQKEITRQDAFDFIAEKHCNIQSQKGTMKQVAEYLTKEDENPLCFGCDLEAAKSKQKSIFGQLAERIKDGKTLDEIDDEFPAAVLNHKRKLDDYMSFQEAKRRRIEVRENPKRGYLLFEHEELTVELGFPRAFRTKQYFITGPTGTGKTTLINSLSEQGFRGFPLPIDGKFDEWSDDLYDFMYIDEFNSQLTLTIMNQLLDGQLMCLTCRYQNKIKKKNIPIFLMSNKRLEDLYPNTPVAMKAALASRLEIISMWENPTGKLKYSLTLQETPVPSP